MGHHIFRLFRRGFVSVGSVVTCGGVLVCCGGGAGSGDEGPLQDPAGEQNPGDRSSGGEFSEDEALGGAGAAAGVGTESAECASSFEACGGLLEGLWTVDGTCNAETRARSALQSWGPELTYLENSACSGALGTLTSRWNGSLLFQGGELIDERQRYDRMEIELSQECLGSALGADISEQNLGAACSGFALESASCLSVGGACHCTGERQEVAHSSGPYGVLADMRVAFVTTGTTSIAEYCVQGDVLRWQEPETRQVLVLRRGPEPATPDPLEGRPID